MYQLNKVIPSYSNDHPEDARRTIYEHEDKINVEGYAKKYIAENVGKKVDEKFPQMCSCEEHLLSRNLDTIIDFAGMLGFFFEIRRKPE